ncbi:MAG: MFS transporter [Candidatus Bathyarchaeota archaeon]|nr:MFS transporter [Candidatus Termiticorpusculum sp.]
MGTMAILSSTMSKNPVLNPFAVSLGTPTDFLGIIAAASTIPGILISLPAASLSDVFGRKKILLFATFIFASAPFLYLGVTQWWQLALVRFYHGFATAMFIPVAEATIVERFPDKKGERISAFNSATYIGRGIAPFLGGSILFITSYSFHTLYIAVATAGITTFIIATLLLAENKTNNNINTQPVKAKIATRKILQGWLKIAYNKSAVIVSFIQACQYYVYGVVEFYLVQYMIEIANINAIAVSIIIGTQIISLITLRPILGRLSDKYGRRLPIILGCTISAILLFLIPFTTQFPILLALSIGYGIGFALVISSTTPLMCELTPTNLIGTSMGFLSTTMDIGQTLGPIISGIILSTVLAYTGLFTSLTILLIASAIIFTLSGIGKQHRTPLH